MVRSEARTSSTGTYTTTYGYDPDGNRSKIGYPSGLTVNCTLDYTDRPASAASGTTTFAQGATYLPFGPQASVQLAGGLVSTSYDSRYRVSESDFSHPTTVGDAINPGYRARYSYGYDGVGNITSIADLLDGTSQDGTSHGRNFVYDDLNRLTSASTGSALWGTMAYSYDAMGNMLQSAVSRSILGENGGPPMTFVASSRAFGYLTNAGGANLPKLQTVTQNGLDHSVTYDNAGNETAYFMTRTYSPRNLLASVQDSWEISSAHKILYAYDGRGVRVQKSETPTGYTASTATRDYIYAPELHLLSVSRPNNPTIYGKRAVVANDVLNAQYDIVWFGGVPVAHIDYDSGTTRTTFTDHLGTPIMQVDNSGTILWQADYEPFGNVWQMRVGGAADQPLRFPGQERAMDWRVRRRTTIYSGGTGAGGGGTHSTTLRSH